MKKPRHFIGKSSFHKDFGEIFVRLAERHGRHEVWSDFITMSACAVSNASDTRFQKLQHKHQRLQYLCLLSN